MTRVATRFKAKDRDRAVSSLAGRDVPRARRRADERDARLARLRSAALRLRRVREAGRRRPRARHRTRCSCASRRPTEKADIKAHLDAIAAWTRDTAGGGVMQTAGALEAAAVTRHLLEPSIEARDEAIAQDARVHREGRGGPHGAPRARHAGHARRGPRGGPRARDGRDRARRDPPSQRRPAGRPRRHRQGAGRRAPRARSRARGRHREARVRQVARPRAHAPSAAAPGAQRRRRLRSRRRAAPRRIVRRCAAEAYRLDSTSPEPAAFVAAMLVDLGMGEAAPAILADAVKAQKDPRIVGLALAITMQAMGRGARGRGARQRASHVPRRRSDPRRRRRAEEGGHSRSPSRVYGMMGEIEIREGRLDEARKLLTASVEREKSGSVLLSLARLDWHDGQVKSAESRLKEALGADDVAKDPALRGEVLLLQSDITREQGDASGARKPLADALRDLAKAAAPPRATIAHASSGSSRVCSIASARRLERDEGARARARGRASRQASGRGDDRADRRSRLREGRSRRRARRARSRARRRAPARGHRLLRDLGARPRAAAEGDRREHRRTRPRRCRDDPRWIGRVAAFGAGKLKAPELVAAAQTPTQKTEALFYAAMDRRIAGDAKGADDGLKQVISSPGSISWRSRSRASSSAARARRSAAPSPRSACRRPSGRR